MRSGNYFGGAPAATASQAFETSFKNAVYDGECYYNPSLKIDKRTKEIKEAHKETFATIQKAILSNAPTYAAGNLPVLIPVFVDPTIVDISRKQTPLVELLPRVAVRGNSVDYNRLTAKGGASFLAEDAALADVTDTYERKTVPVKYAYSVGRVTGQAIAAGAGFIDMRAQDILVKTAALKELEETTTINGDSVANPLEYDGLRTLIATNVTDLLGAPVALADIRTAIAQSFNSGGNVNLAVTDASTHNAIKGLLMTFQRYVDKAEDLPFGIAGSFSIDGVAFIKSRFMPTGAGVKEILFLDTSVVEMGVLLDATFEDLAKTNDSQKFMIKEYLALILRAEEFCSKIINVA